MTIIQIGAQKQRPTRSYKLQYGQSIESNTLEQAGKVCTAVLLLYLGEYTFYLGSKRNNSHDNIQSSMLVSRRSDLRPRLT